MMADPANLVSAIAAAAYAQSDEAVKVALVGCGGRGTGAAAQALGTPRPTRLWAVADVYEDRMEDSLARLKGAGSVSQGDKAEDLSRKIDVPRSRRFIGFDGYKAVVESGADVVILATPPGFRSYHFEYAVQHGRNIFMEKPIAVDAAGIRRILAANELAKQQNLKIGVGLQRRHQAPYLETIRRIHDGAIGDPVALRCYWNSGGAQWRSRELGANELQYQVRNWYYFTWLSGDHIVEQHIHNLDVCSWIMHDVGSATAQGMGGRQVRTSKQYGQIYDHHDVEYTYDNGVVMISQCRHVPNAWSSVSEHVHGTKGCADVSNATIYQDKAGRKVAWRYEGDKSNPYQQEHDDLFDAVRNDQPYNEVDYAAVSTMTAIMGRMASYTGRVVRWKDAMESEQVLAPPIASWDDPAPVQPDAEGHYPVARPGVTELF